MICNLKSKFQLNGPPDLTQNIMRVALFKSQWSKGDSLPSVSGQDIFGVDINAKNDYIDMSSNGGVDAKVKYLFKIGP